MTPAPMIATCPSPGCADRSPRGHRRGGRGPDRADRGGLKQRHRIAGVIVVEDQHRRGTRDACRDVAGETRDPLDPGHRGRGQLDESRQRDDPGLRLVGEPQEIAVRVDRPASVVPQIGILTTSTTAHGEESRISLTILPGTTSNENIPLPLLFVRYRSPPKAPAPARG